MLDDTMRRVKDRVYRPVARRLAHTSPLWLTFVSFLWGVAAALALWRGSYAVAFAAWFANRFFDGLDGAVARSSNLQSDFGGYADIVADFAIYALVPFSLVLGRSTPAGWLALSVLLVTFYVNGASWMYLSAILEKRTQGAAATGKETTVAMPGGVVGGTVTIVFYSLFILFPGWLVPLFWSMSVLVIVGIGQRLLWAWRALR